MTQPLLREILDIPEDTSTSDLVLDLNRGVEDLAATIADYTVTDRLIDNFDQALGLIRHAVQTGSSKAAYLHGSFGSGKSHFMAVLFALLDGNPAARRKDDLVGLVARHSVWLDGKRFLLVTSNMMGAQSLEQRVLADYVTRVRRMHPEAPIPAVHRTDGLLEQAAFLRRKVGDKEFIAGLPGGSEEEDEWGTTSRWDSARLDEAFASPFDADVRRDLVNDLLVSWNQGFFTNAVEDAEAFVSLDRGLTEATRHAEALGYGGLILFIDELILWIANRSADREFVAREIQKITNLVEGGNTRRAIPVVTFIARQRDLRDLVGKEVTGAQELSFQDTLNLASGRFDVITLEDRNLPAVAKDRVLRLNPANSNAATTLDAAFEATTKVRREIWDTLLGSEARTGSDKEAFRQTYPFSPVFMDTLVHVSSALQRTRSGLKLMRQLLVDRRDDLRVGDLVPLGDLYDVISKPGDEPFTEKLKVEFEQAQKLYQGKLRPSLLDQHHVGEDDVLNTRKGKAEPQTAARVRTFLADDRLIKTLLLAALAPTVPALRNLTARKLAALNHGTIRTRIPGQEATVAANKIRDWAAQFGEIRVAEGDDPGVSLHLVGVDVDSVLDAVRKHDKPGARKAIVQSLLWEELGLKQPDALLESTSIVWRGSVRTVELLYGKVRDPNELSDAMFTPDDPNGWRLIIDYPIEDGSHGPADARHRVSELAARIGGVRTVCWVPAAMTSERVNRDLSRLVLIEAVLRDNQFESAAAHLGPEDRIRAREQLVSQQASLTGKLRQVLRQAFGLAQKQSQDVVLGYSDHLLTLVRGFAPTLPAGATFTDALRSMISQMLACQYPEHPDLDPDRTGSAVRASDAKIVIDAIRTVVESGADQAEIEHKPHRAVLRRIVEPLRLGTMHSAVLRLDRHWVQHFQQRAAAEGAALDSDLPVATLLGWIPAAMGLDQLMAQLVVTAFAEQTNRSFYLHGGPTGVVEPGRFPQAGLTLRPQRLPSDVDWESATDRAVKLFRLTARGPAVSRIVAMLARDISARAKEHRDDAHRLLNRLTQHADTLGLDRSATVGRFATANRAVDLLDALASSAADVEIVELLARADLGGPAERVGRSIITAKQVAAALQSGPWDDLATLRTLPEPYDSEARLILDQLAAVARDDELTQHLEPALRLAREDAVTLIRRALQPTTTPGAAGTQTQDGAQAGTDAAVVIGGRTVAANEIDTAITELRHVAQQHRDKTIDVRWSVK
ncbi:phage resistance protein [Actinomycetes bacterium KLBMP 9797]